MRPFSETVHETTWPSKDPVEKPMYIPAGTMQVFFCLWTVIKSLIQHPVQPTLYLSCTAEKICGAQMVRYSVKLSWAIQSVGLSSALEFDPDRFLDDRVQKYLIPNPFIFIPFNAGPRICLGQQVCAVFLFNCAIGWYGVQFAYNEVSFMLIRLLQSFSTISLDIDAQPPNTRVPAWWAKVPGRQSIEKFWPKTHLTMYAHVRHSISFFIY